MPTWKQYKLSVETSKYDNEEVRKGLDKKFPFKKRISIKDWGKLKYYLREKERSLDKKSLHLFLYGTTAEMYYIIYSRPILFCESVSLAEMLNNSNFEVNFNTLISSASILKFKSHNKKREKHFYPVTCFSIAWPSELKIMGISAQPILVTFLENGIIVQLRRDFLCPCVTYINTQDLLDEFVLSSNEPPKTPDFNEFLFAGFKRLFGLSMKLVVYAISNNFEEGVPEGMKARAIKNYKNQPLRTISVPEECKASPSIHWRKGHLRQLKSEFYKRDQFGLPRIIPVKGTTVGRAKTAITKEDTWI